MSKHYYEPQWIEERENTQKVKGKLGKNLQLKRDLSFHKYQSGRKTRKGKINTQLSNKYDYVTLQDKLEAEIMAEEENERTPNLRSHTKGFQRADLFSSQNEPLKPSDSNSVYLAKISQSQG